MSDALAARHRSAQRSGYPAVTQPADQLSFAHAQRGVVENGPVGALAHLGLARAYAQTGDIEKSLAEYREFLTLWKNADPDLRILKDAEAEYKKLSERLPSSL